MAIIITFYVVCLNDFSQYLDMRLLCYSQCVLAPCCFKQTIKAIQSHKTSAFSLQFSAFLVFVYFPVGGGMEWIFNDFKGNPFQDQNFSCKSSTFKLLSTANPSPRNINSFCQTHIILFSCVEKHTFIPLNYG